MPKRRVRLNGQDVEPPIRIPPAPLMATRRHRLQPALLAKIWRGDTFVTVRSVDTLVKPAAPHQPIRESDASAHGVGVGYVRGRLKLGGL